MRRYTRNWFFARFLKEEEQVLIFQTVFFQIFIPQPRFLLWFPVTSPLVKRGEIMWGKKRQSEKFFLYVWYPSIDWFLLAFRSEVPRRRRDRIPLQKRPCLKRNPFGRPRANNGFGRMGFRHFFPGTLASWSISRRRRRIFIAAHNDPP